MGTQTDTEMSVEERDDVLGSGGTGVISFSRGTDAAPRTVPVSYGYDPVEATFYFRLSTRPDGEDDDLRDRPVSFVTYGETDDGWHSVVARGRLEPTTDEAIAAETLDGLQRVTIPYVDVFDRPLRQVSFEFVRLEPDELTARTGD